MQIKFLTIFFIVMSLHVSVQSNDGVETELALPELGDRVSGAVSAFHKKCEHLKTLNQMLLSCRFVFDQI